MTTFIRALRADLSHYTRAALEATLGSEAMAAVRREQRVPALVRARRLSILPTVKGNEVKNVGDGCEQYAACDGEGNNSAAGREDNGGRSQSSGYQGASCGAEKESVRLALVARLLLLGDVLTEEELIFAFPVLSSSGHMGRLVEVSRRKQEENGNGNKDDKKEEKNNFSDVVSHDSCVYRARFQIVPVEVPPHIRQEVDREKVAQEVSYTNKKCATLGGRNREESPVAYACAEADKEKSKGDSGAEEFSSVLLPSEVLIASDWGELAGVKPREDHVMPVGGATRTLAALATYTPGQRVIDIGTGCGVHAIFAALAGADVTATDISSRAVEYARFNAALNGVDIKVKEGSLAEPAEGLYDVVVSNPPFVITPGKVRDIADYRYRDGGREGDSLLGELMLDLPRILAPGGRAWMLGNWEIREEWEEKPRSWIGEELDAWVIQREELTPAQYVEMWLRDGGVTPGDERYEKMYEAWLSDFEERGVRYVGMGYLCVGMRRCGDLRAGEEGDVCVREGQPWRRFDVFHGPSSDNLAQFIEKIWKQRHYISSYDFAGVDVTVDKDGCRPIGGEKLSEGYGRVNAKVNEITSMEERSRKGKGEADACETFGVSIGEERVDDEGMSLNSSHDSGSCLLDVRLKVKAIEHRLHMPGSADPFMIKLAQMEGFSEEIQVSSNVAAVVGACDGELTLGVLCDAVAHLTGTPSSDIYDEVFPAVNELLALGILVVIK